MASALPDEARKNDL